MRGIELVFASGALLVAGGCAGPKSGQDRAPAGDADVDGTVVADAQALDAMDATDAADASDSSQATDALDASEAGDAPPSCQPILSTGAAIFVLDSTNSLLAFDSSGNALGSVAAPSPIGLMNGGGIALASGNLYLTVGEPANAISEFSLGLAPQSLEAGAFAGTSVPRGIAFDCQDRELFVTNGSLGFAEPLDVYDLWGTLVLVDGGLPNSYGASGISYDPDDGTLWVANYPGFPTAQYGVAEYSETAEQVQTFDYSTQFVSPGNHQEPYAIAVCPKAVVGGATLVVVGFIDDGSGLGTGAVQAYTIDGAPHGASYAFAKPNALSCNSSGRVYVADHAGLFSIDIRDGTPGTSLPGPFPGLTPPVYGVVAGD
jgi:hypothetical protein